MDWPRRFAQACREDEVVHLGEAGVRWAHDFTEWVGADRLRQPGASRVVRGFYVVPTMPARPSIL